MTDYTKIKIADAFKHIDSQHNLVDDVSAGFSSIRYRDKTWKLSHGGKIYPFRRDDDNTPLSYIDVIILGIAPGTARVYFGGEWTEDSNNAPLCTSRKGDVPDPGVPVPQSESCGTCKQAEWVMQPNGRRKPNCQEHKNVAVLLVPTMTKKMFNGSPLVEPVYLKIPPNSRRSFKAYTDELQDQSFPFQAVITRVGFSPDRQFEMSFVLTQALSNAEARVVLPLMDSSVTRQILGSGPAVRTIEKSKTPVREETGLMEAFGAEAVNVPDEEHVNHPIEAQKRGRPAGTKNKPKLVESDRNDVAKETAAKPAPAAPVPEEGNSWENSDDELDDSVAKLMGDKLNNMLK